jgi:hypothetical protein
MPFLVMFLLVLGCVLLLLFGLLSVLRSLLERDVLGSPSFQEPGPIFHDQHVEPIEQLGARSQFAWQSRSHFRAPD